MLARSRGLAARAATLSVTIVAATCLFVLAGCSDEDDKIVNPPGAQDTVHIVSGAATLGPLAYTPNPDTVTAGTTVRWVNNDTMTHTATSDTGVFNLTIPSGGSASFRFQTAGSFPYHCAVTGHVMTGTVVVLP